MAEQKEARIQMTSQQEVDLLKQTFKGNEHLLKAVRMLLYGLPVSDENKQIIKKTFSSPEVKKAVRKKIYPIFEEDIPEVPVNSLADYWYGTEQNIIGQSRDTIYQSIEMKVRLQKLLEQAINLLDDPYGTPINLKYEHNLLDDLGIGLLTRNLYIKTINEGINFIKIVSDREDEPKAVAEKKAIKNSNK